MRRSSVLLLILSIPVLCLPVSLQEALSAAETTLTGHRTIMSESVLHHRESGETLAYVFELYPAGYVILSSSRDLPPVIAYSSLNSLGANGGSENLLTDMVSADLSARMDNLEALPEEYRQSNRALWESLISGETDNDPLQQWPPEGTTATEGWLEENWTQGAPYNMYCPMDLIAGSRSIAGCPAVAMGSILNFLECTNSTRFDDNDDYYHNYNEYYWIDDDFDNHDFPSWPELNVLLDTLETHYITGHITDSDKGTVVYASGAACRQVYTASVSGTFGVDQAYDAYLRFGFTDCELLFEDSDSLYQRLAQNMMEGMPAHLAIIDEGPQYGHNVVVDGYNTDEFFHLNFGWGGSNNGWYSFPLTGMPYGMNIIEGVVLDIGEPLQSAEGSQVFPAGIRISTGSNPVSSAPSLTVSVPETASGDLTVYSVDGRIMNRQHSLFPEGESQHSIGTLPPGIYIIRISSGSDADTVMLTVLSNR